MNSPPAAEARNGRLRSSAGSISGAAARRSTARNTNARAREASSSSPTGARSQPSRPRVSAVSSAVIARPSTAAPARSGRPPRGARDSSSVRKAKAAVRRAARPSTTYVSRQSTEPSDPASSGPSAIPALTNAPQTPVALILAAPAGNAPTSRPRLVARIAALAAPWATRASVNVRVSVVRAPSPVVRPRASVPSRKSLRRP